MQILRGPEHFHRRFYVVLKDLRVMTIYIHSPYFKTTSHDKIDSSLTVYIEVFLNVGKLWYKNVLYNDGFYNAYN